MPKIEPLADRIEKRIHTIPLIIVLSKTLLRTIAEEAAAEAYDEIERLRTAFEQIADIAEGSQTVNSLPHITKIAREVLNQ